MSTDLELIAAELAEVKAMLKQVVDIVSAADQQQLSRIVDDLRIASACGADPVAAMAKYRVSGRSMRPGKSTRRKHARI